MKSIGQTASGNPQLTSIWRFYSDASHRWRWQRLDFDGTVVEGSKSAYSQYEGCLANATKHGYVSSPSLSTKPISGSSKRERSYARLPAWQHKLVSNTASEALVKKDDIPIDDAMDELITKENL